MGTDVSERLAFEAMFFYSRHLIHEEYWKNGLNIYQEMDQYNFGALAKYTIFNGVIRPYVNGVANVTRRDYSEIGVNTRRGKLKVRDLDKDAMSTAFDVGFFFGF